MSIKKREWEDCDICKNNRFVLKKYPETPQTYQEVIGQRIVSEPCPNCNPNPPKISYD